jgi:CRISPR-associated exonuclease Cas4
VRIVRGVALRSLALGVCGIADVVEFSGRPPRPFPVEYKRGKPKAHRADEVQLCAQAICPEEMFGGEVDEGALFYGTTRRRHAVAFDAALHMLTAETAAAAQANIAAAHPPPPMRTPAGRRCLLETLCQPARLQKPPHIARWLAGQIAG